MSFRREQTNSLPHHSLSHTVLSGQILTRWKAGPSRKVSCDDLLPDVRSELKISGLIHVASLTAGYPARKLYIRMASRIAG
jgi:hypothetical protein